MVVLSRFRTGYVEVKYRKVIELSEEYQKNYSSIKNNRRNSLPKIVDRKKSVNPPGEIKNDILLKKSGRAVELIANQVELSNYICVPEYVWSQLIAIYQGGPPIERNYPKIYLNMIVKVQLNEENKFVPRKFKKYARKGFGAKEDIRDKASTKEHNEKRVPYYKYPGKNNWLLVPEKIEEQDEIFSCPKTFLVFVPRRLQRDF